MKKYVKIQEAYFQDYITLYGIQVEYFSRNLNYYDANGNIKELFNSEGGLNHKIRDYTYFNGPERYEFGVMMPIKVITDYGTDNFMFQGMGLDMTTEGKFYITKKQFQQDCLQFFGLPKQANISLTIPCEIRDWKTYCPVNKVIPFYPEKALTYKVEVSIPEVDPDTTTELGDIIENISFPTTGKVNPEYATNYKNNQFVEIDEESINSQISDVSYNKEGKGNCNILLNFSISYNSFRESNDSHYDTLDGIINKFGEDKEVPITFAPKVGDFIRLRMLDNPNQFRDYAITFVNDTNLDKDSISPYITSFVWECSITRRKPSHEIVNIEEPNKPNTPVPSMEKGIESVLDNRQQQTMQDITREEEVYDYNQRFDDVNGELVDNIDYQKDAIFGSLGNSDEQMPTHIKDVDWKTMRETKKKKMVSSSSSKRYTKRRTKSEDSIPDDSED